MLLGYNTNGFAHHRLADAFKILAEIGYRSVAVTLERDVLDPPDRSGVPHAIEVLRPLVASSGLHVTLETGARFLLDPNRKHQPTLLSRKPEGRKQRLEYLRAAVEIAAGIGADCVSLWSGTADDGTGEEELFARLQANLREVLRHAESRGIRLAFEPEPGMFIDTMARFARLHAAISHPLLGLTLDVGHVHCLHDADARTHVRQWRDQLWNVHLEDMRRGVHEHLPFGQGDMDFAEVFAALREVSYTGPIHVELPRQSHDAVIVARQSYEFLQNFAAMGVR